LLLRSSRSGFGLSIRQLRCMYPRRSFLSQSP